MWSVHPSVKWRSNVALTRVTGPTVGFTRMLSGPSVQGRAGKAEILSRRRLNDGRPQGLVRYPPIPITNDHVEDRLFTHAVDLSRRRVQRPVRLPFRLVTYLPGRSMVIRLLRLLPA